MTGDDLPETHPGERPGDTAGQKLRAVTVTIGAMTAVWVGVLLASEAGDGPMPVPRALIALLPALLAAMPFTLPERWRPRADAVVATVVTIYMIADFPVSGVHFLPMVLLLWATTIVPWRMRHRRGPVAVRLWHIAAGLLVALPGLASAASAGKDMLPILSWAALVYIGGPLTLGVLCALRFRAAYGVIALVGTASMFSAILDPGFLLAAFWWFGGLYLTIGLTGWVTTPPRHRTPTEADPDEAANIGTIENPD